ncbi:hypothetical protein BP5796_07859 [Coleophoma crateriformis]|uniref:Fork-head domain-containing protein n=1 Tax=Coleophoma crateriformis TaxID=565419 RepID=A0A3D8RCS0_9HELO|nr:hypothetical protein BP5796_07859 [Coleophoma crateriformis]
MFKPLNASVSGANVNKDGRTSLPTMRQTADIDSTREYFEVCESPANGSGSAEVGESYINTNTTVQLLVTENRSQIERSRKDSRSASHESSREREVDDGERELLGTGATSQPYKRKSPAYGSPDINQPRRSVTGDDSTGEPSSPHRRKRAKTEDEKEQRRLERLLSNRLAAEKSRERKRKEFEALKAEKEDVERKNQDLEMRLAEIEARVALGQGDREFFQVVEESEPPKPVPIVGEQSNGSRDDLAREWQELRKRSEALEQERREVESRRVQDHTEPTTINPGDENTWKLEKKRLIQEHTAKMDQMLADHKRREDEIQQLNHEDTKSIVAERDQHAVKLVNLLHQKDGELAQKDQHIQDLHKIADLKTEALKAAEAHFSTREDLMKTLVSSLDGAVKGKDDTIATLEATVEAKKAEIESLKLELHTRNNTNGQTDQAEDAEKAQPEASHVQSINPAVALPKSLELAPPGKKSSSPSPATQLFGSRPDHARRNTSDSAATGDEIVVASRTSIASESYRIESREPDDSGDAEGSDLRTSVGARKRSSSRRITDSPLTAAPKKAWKVRNREKKDKEAEEEFEEIKHDDGSKPGHSYTQLIGMAIVESPDRQLRLAEIYKWISDTYSFYSVDAPLRKDWKNAIRSTLSTNKKFIRQWRPGEDPGKGSYWGIQEGEDEEFIGRPIYIKARSSWHRVGKMKKSAP